MILLTKLPAAILIYLFAAGCNTLSHVKGTRIEILVPANVVFPPDYKNIAIRYNNSNVSFNPYFAEYRVGKKIASDSVNIDSVASEHYYRSFLEMINENSIFDDIKEVQRGRYSNVILTDSLIQQKLLREDDSLKAGMPVAILHFKQIATKFQPKNKLDAVVKAIDPDYGLYKKNELKAIKDSTGADMLLSLDFFAELEDRLTTDNLHLLRHVYIITFWNFYDLNKMNLSYFYNRVDTITWELLGVSDLTSLRKDALILAAEISGTQFAQFLVPSWTEVERVYYPPWKWELKATKKLISDGKWKKAAEYWKRYTNDKNKNTASKSMFNMAVACEIENQTDAAIDWAVRSYHTSKEFDTAHRNICMDYINILKRRKKEIEYIDHQLNPALKITE